MDTYYIGGKFVQEDSAQLSAKDIIFKDYTDTYGQEKVS
jgi:hypothetical protein